MENVNVFLRIKKTNKELHVEKNKILFFNNNYFEFNKIFYEENQKILFEKIIKNQLKNILEGINCTVFAYGQTGSGKTYTIQKQEIQSEDDYGLILNCVKNLIPLLNSQYKIFFSYLEIYNENLKCLLSNRKINFNESKKIPIKNFENFLTEYLRGMKNRKFSATSLNSNSSRSHTIFTIYINFRDRIYHKTCKINIVDLAGSESLKNQKIEKEIVQRPGDFYQTKIESSCSEENDHHLRRTETGCINRSSLCLGEVIKKRASNSKFINYRDSKLTYFLRDTISGNSLLSVIGTVCIENKTETLSTLNFLENVKQINIKTVKNLNSELSKNELSQKYDYSVKENEKLKSDIDLLKSKQVSLPEGSFDNRSFYIFKEEIQTILKDIHHISRDVDLVRKDNYELICEKLENEIKKILEMNSKLF